MNLYCDHEVWSNDNGRPYRPSLQDLQQTRMEILRRLNRDRFMEANSRPISICTMSSSNDEFPEELDNASLKAELLRKNETIEFQEIFDVRRRLPVIKQCRDILRAIGGHQVTLIVGSTGCGKTTQIPQMVLDDFIFNNCGTECRIACVELVKSNAILAAERVAHERLESVGNSIGLQVGGRIIKPRETGYVIYCTPQMLIRKLQSDPHLRTLSAVILDDIQDQCGEFNQLMEHLQTILPYRPDLKVILMSTTVSEDTFCEYFRDYHALYIHEAIYPSCISKTSSISTMQEVIENVECAITSSDEECVEEDDNDNVEMLAKECAYRNSQAFLKKYSGRDISLLSKKLKRRLKKHRKNVRTYERIHLNMIKDMQCDAEALTGDTTATKRAQRNDHIPSAPIKRRRLSSLSCHQDLQVAIIDKSDPHGRLDDDMWLKLEEKLIAELISSRWCNEEIAFDGANWSRGVKIVKCGNSKTLDFLKETITNVCANWPHIHLEIINRSALPLRIFARMWIPQPVPSNDTILTLIQKQNDGISTENWRIINSKPSKKNPGKDYRMFIDGNSAKAILQCNGRIHFGLNFIRIHVGNVN